MYNVQFNNVGFEVEYDKKVRAVKATMKFHDLKNKKKSGRAEFWKSFEVVLVKDERVPIGYSSWDYEGGIPGRPPQILVILCPHRITKPGCCSTQAARCARCGVCGAEKLEPVR